MEQETKIVDLSNRVFKLVAVLIVGSLVLCLGWLLYQFKSLPQNYPQQISVSGQGKVFTKPDVATVVLGVENQGANSQTVVEQNNQTMNRVIAAMKEAGIEEKDIQTSSYHLTPLYSFMEREMVFYGYMLNQQIQVKIRNFDKISEVLDRAISSGATNVGKLRFTVDDIEAYRSEARAKAIEQAKEKAADIAGQSGLRLKKLVNVYESDGGYPIAHQMYGIGGADVKEFISAAPQIEAGEMEIVSNITLTYWIQ